MVLAVEINALYYYHYYGTGVVSWKKVERGLKGFVL